MKRKDFLKKAMVLGAVGASVPAALGALHTSPNQDEGKYANKLGYNHLPNKEIKTMKTVYHPAHTRGNANHGWLQSYHSFSFANYHNPERMNFGVLRVLNDDVVAAGMGFGTHPHNNMEIISIPLSGDLEHKDSMGNTGVIQEGDVQVLSAGTGIQHSEYNKNSDREVKFLQIWVMPNKQDVTPRYDQIKINSAPEINGLTQILSPNPEDAGVWIHQNAWFHMAHLKANQESSYTLKNPKNGLYSFVLEGEVNMADQVLNKRDALGIWDTPEVKISPITDTKILLMEVPMELP